MKKYVFIIIILAIAGAAFSAILLIEHYDPLLLRDTILCADDSCVQVAQSEHSFFLGIPVAAYGLFFHLFLLFTVLIADYAKNNYYVYCLAILLPLSAASLLIDAALGTLLIINAALCLLCIAIYVIDVFIFIFLVAWYRCAREYYRLNYRELLKSTFRGESSSPDRKAAYSLYVIFSFLLLFAVFSTNHILKIKSAGQALPEEKVQAMLNTFYSTPPVDLKLPASGMVIGSPDAPVTIVAFTDFLCSACNMLFSVEKYLLSRYRGKVRFVFYSYPLDKSCNRHVGRTLYKNGCIAARAAFAASRLNFFDKFYMNHFRNYDKLHDGYDRRKALATASDFIMMEKDTFYRTIDSPEAFKTVKRDIELAEKLGIEATPTIFINGRKMVGVFPSAVYDRIIMRELRERKQQSSAGE